MAIYSLFSHKKLVIFHSYVSLPEGTILTLTFLWLVGFLTEFYFQGINTPPSNSQIYQISIKSITYRYNISDYLYMIIYYYY